jgi:hypothetical protein
MNEVDDVLAHYGIKGMKWGVRRDRSGSSGSDSGRKMLKVKIGKSKAEKMAIKTKNQTDDHKEFAALAIKAKKYGVSSLTNKELSTYLTRMDLNVRYAKHNPKKKNPAVEIVKDLLVSAGKKKAAELLADPKKAKDLFEMVANIDSGKHAGKKLKVAGKLAGRHTKP